MTLSNGELPGFTNDIYLLTGASGGMLGASYFAAMRAKSSTPICKSARNESRIVECLLSDIRAANCGDRDFCLHQTGDSLTPVIRQLINRDLWHIFWPARLDRDRGKTLEDQWQALDISFSDMLEGEQEGWRPHLVFSPMIIESGRPLLISNLNVTPIRATTRSLSREPNQHPVGEETLELFQMYPEAHRSFKVSTAVRMSATFPFISPAVRLPAKDSARIVDAGYYDNYGVNFIASFLQHPSVRGWIEDNTSGVIVVEARAHPSDISGSIEDDEIKKHMNDAKCELIGSDDQAQSALEQFVNRLPFGGADAQSSLDKEPPYSLRRGFEWFISPWEGAEAARSKSMLFRNNKAMEAVDSIYSLSSANRNVVQASNQANFITRISLVNNVKSSYNWIITKKEIDCMKIYLDQTLPIDEFRKAWLSIEPEVAHSP